MKISRVFILIKFDKHHIYGIINNATEINYLPGRCRRVLDKAMYTLLERDIEEDVVYELTDEQYQILEEEEAKYSCDEANQIIKGLRDF